LPDIVMASMNKMITQNRICDFRRDNKKKWGGTGRGAWAT